MASLVAISLIVVVSGACFALTAAIQRATKRAAGAVPAPVIELKREPENAIERFVVAMKQRQAARVSLSVLSVGLLLGAAGVIGYPFYTNLYQERVQGRLDSQLSSDEHRDAYANRALREGDALTRILIPEIGVNMVVVAGTTSSALRAGAGHYTGSPMPCEIGNVAIAGHRTTYGRPFHDVDLLELGSQITLQTPLGECTYEVTEEPFIVMPEQTEVVANVADESLLTLTTCHPKGSARERLIIRAEMVSSTVADA